LHFVHLRTGPLTLEPQLGKAFLHLRVDVREAGLHVGIEARQTHIHLGFALAQARIQFVAIQVIHGLVVGASFAPVKRHWQTKHQVP
jgi:hypothetical protein